MDHLKPVVDIASVGTIIATLTGLLPSVAALVSIIWGCIRIYETATVQRWINGKVSDESDS